MDVDSILVTGGAGYIGSHTARQLIDAGFSVVVIDNLSTGQPWAVPDGAAFRQGDCADQSLVDETIRRHRIGTVIHFAGSVVVPESVLDPLKYYHNNVEGSARLIESCLRRGVNRFLFSSSAAVYGIAARSPVDESAPTIPINPYGRTKLITEWMLGDIARARSEFRFIALRYFNVAGARLDGTLGQATPGATHLIKVACEVACGLRPQLTVFGTDYDTPDGTGVRDYIHVDDLAAAHLLAVGSLRAGGPSRILNCGYGRGFSVREVIEAIRAVSGRDFRVEYGKRRSGDPPSLVADSGKIRAELGWTPRHDDLSLICRTAYYWEQNYARRFRD